MDKIFVDVGSSTVKAYKISGQNITSLLQKTFYFKTGFDSDVGIDKELELKLIALFKDIQNTYPTLPIKICATGIFRKINSQAKTVFIDRFFEQTGLFFNIINHDLENFYLEQALLGKCMLDEPVLFMNIGGGSVELLVKKCLETIEQYNIDLGIGTVLTKFPKINQSFSEVTIEEVLDFIKTKLPEIKNKVRYAVYNGGELTYMRLAKYRLEENSIFVDKDHPSMISRNNFNIGNRKVFSEISLEDLERLMPNDPKWMYGARACSAIAESVTSHFGVEYIIPSDSNLVNGVVRQEFRSVVLSGSFRKHLDYILDIKKQLTQQNILILSPRFEKPKNPKDDFVVFQGEEGLSPLELERYHLKSIDQADALIVCDPGGYVGASSLIEIGYAQAKNKRIIFTEKPEEFIFNILPSEIGI